VLKIETAFKMFARLLFLLDKKHTFLKVGESVGFRLFFVGRLNDFSAENN